MYGRRGRKGYGRRGGRRGKVRRNYYVSRGGIRI